MFLLNAKIENRMCKWGLTAWPGSYVEGITAPNAIKINTPNSGNYVRMYYVVSCLLNYYRMYLRVQFILSTYVMEKNRKKYFKTAGKILFSTGKIYYFLSDKILFSTGKNIMDF